MPRYKVTVTRTVSYDESATTEIEADDEGLAIAAALGQDRDWVADSPSHEVTEEQAVAELLGGLSDDDREDIQDSFLAPIPTSASFDFEVLFRNRAILITDLDICWSVANDAEKVLATIADLASIENLDRYRIVYRTAEGRWDALLTNDSMFFGFAPLRAGTADEALERYTTHLRENSP
jgi:hypothetical protein